MCDFQRMFSMEKGDQKKSYKDTLKASLKDFDIPIKSWEQTAQERSKWRGLINKEDAIDRLPMKKKKKKKKKKKP